MNSFEELEVWKSSRILRNDIWKLTRQFPKEELYRLSDQLIRASRSVPANIAEGFGRFHYKEKVKFYYISRGSVCEVQNFLFLSPTFLDIISDGMIYILNKSKKTTTPIITSNCSDFVC